MSQIEVITLPDGSTVQARVGQDGDYPNREAAVRELEDSMLPSEAHALRQRERARQAVEKFVEARVKMHPELAPLYGNDPVKYAALAAEWALAEADGGGAAELAEIALRHETRQFREPRPEPYQHRNYGAHRLAGDEQHPTGWRFEPVGPQAHDYGSEGTLASAPLAHQQQIHIRTRIGPNGPEPDHAAECASWGAFLAPEQTNIKAGLLEKMVRQGRITPEEAARAMGEGGPDDLLPVAEVR